MIMLDFDAFIGKYYPNANAQKTDDVERFLSHVTELADTSPLAEKLLDRDFLCNTFYLQKLNSITRTHYQKIKEYLLNLFDWFGVEGVIPSQEEVISSAQIYTYFRDLENAMQFIDHVGELVLTNYTPTQDLIIVKSIFILGWYGLSLKDIIALKRFWFKKNEDGCGVISIDDKQITVDKESAKVLTCLQYLHSYKSIPSGKIKYLKGNEEYMFRPTTANCEKLTEMHIVQVLKRFNDNTPSYLHQNIAFRCIYRNAKFVDILNDQTDKTLLEKIEIHTKCSPKQVFSYKTQYLAWLELIQQHKI